MPRYRVVETVRYQKVKCYVPLSAESKQEALIKFRKQKDLGMCAWVFDDEKTEKEVVETTVEIIDDEGIA